jgi:cellulose synthase/poly-beta-1,6-N-acetylglucosamine synthase-like glycosyltransferase
LITSVSILYAIVAVMVACALHPFFTYPLSLALFGTRRVANNTGSASRPAVAICLSAYNEEAVIVEKIRSLIAAASIYGPATVHVYTDGCSDRTVELITPFADKFDLVVSPERRGKTHGMNLLMTRSDSPLVMFSDANVVASDQIVAQLAQPFQDPTVGCTTARLLYSNPEESATSHAGSVYWKLEEFIKSIESKTIGVIGVDGASFMVRRELYHQAPENLIDDLYVTLSVLAGGAAVIRVPEAVVYERSAVKAREEYNRKVRIACQAIRVHRHLWPSIRKLPFPKVYGYVSHRLMKWLMPFFLTSAGLALIAALWIQIGWPIVAIALALLALVMIGGRFAVPGLAFVYTVGLSLIGVMNGVLLGLFSESAFVTWDPAQSVREKPSKGSV